MIWSQIYTNNLIYLVIIELSVLLKIYYAPIKIISKLFISQHLFHPPSPFIIIFLDLHRLFSPPFIFFHPFPLDLSFFPQSIIDLFVLDFLFGHSIPFFRVFESKRLISNYLNIMFFMDLNKCLLISVWFFDSENSRLTMNSRLSRLNSR